MLFSQYTVINDTAAGALSTIMLLAVMLKVFVVMFFTYLYIIIDA